MQRSWTWKRCKNPGFRQIICAFTKEEEKKNSGNYRPGSLVLISRKKYKRSRMDNYVVNYIPLKKIRMITKNDGYYLGHREEINPKWLPFLF